MDEVKPMEQASLYFLINSLDKGGAERQVVTLQKALGGKIILLENRIQYSEVNPEDVLFLNSTKAGSFFAKLIQYFGNIFKLGKILKKQNQKTPVVISFLERSNALNLISSFLFGQTTILSVRINLDIQYRSAPFFKVFAKLFYRFSDAVTTNSEGMRQLLIANYNIPESKAFFVPNAYEIHSIQNASETPMDRPELEDLALSSSFLLSVNRLDEQKLIKAQLMLYSELKAKRPEVKFLIVGDGSLRKELVEYGIQLGLQVYDSSAAQSQDFTNNYDVYFLGLLNNPYRLYKLSKCFILTSEYESLPNVVIEALICNATVLVADCRFGPREILTRSTSYHINFDNRYGLNEYGVLLPIPSLTNNAKSLWSKYLLNIFNDQIDLSFKRNIPEKIKDYSKQSVIHRWNRLIK